jgi:hypothetical protein
MNPRRWLSTASTTFYADRRSRIAFITRGIDRAELEASFFEHVVRRTDASVGSRSSEIAPAGE